jgi:hypothetical protein
MKLLLVDNLLGGFTFMEGEIGRSKRIRMGEGARASKLGGVASAKTITEPCEIE